MEVANKTDGGAPPFPAKSKKSEKAAGVPAQVAPRQWPRPAKVVPSANHQRSGSFHRWMNQVQRAWSWVPPPREEGLKSSFNPEVLVNQKRQWYRLHSRGVDRKQHAEPMSLFEQFFIVGLNSDTNVAAAVEDALAKGNNWNSKMAKSEIQDLKNLQCQQGSLPPLEPQILFKYPQRKRLPVRVKDIPAFCFPRGIKARLLEKTPSMSDLNEVVYGQEHLCRDDLSFIFSLKVADNATLYGVCLHVQEIVHRPPCILGVTSPLPRSSGLRNSLLFSAPRCYCILTRVPFFELHYEMLNSIIAQERLERITQFVSEMAFQDSALPVVTTQDQTDEKFNSADREGSTDFIPSAIPIDSVLGFTPTALEVVPDNELHADSLRQLEPESLESGFSNARELGKDTGENLQCSGDFASKVKRSHSDCFERVHGIFENDQVLSEGGINHCSVKRTLGRVSSSDSFFVCSVKSMGSEEEDVDEVDCIHEKNATDEEVMKWAKENKNDLLQIVCGYHALPLPSRGSEIIFQPLDHLQPIKYGRPGISALGLGEKCSNIKPSGSSAEVAEVNEKLAAAEEALALSIWSTATVCRALSLESVLALFTGALLEKQVLVVCPNLGVLSAIVLSVIPMIRPFQWQSLLLPILPRKMLAFLDAPVPFIVGVQNKPAETKMKTSNFVHINVQKDQQVKMWSLPQLPRHRELITQLGPIHARLSCENSIAKRHPVYKCSEVQAEAAWQFLNVMRWYLESLCSDLRSHTITSVQSNNDKVSLLLKDSFIDSFPTRDQPFIKLFVETQLFSALSDSRLSGFENE
ncbi:DENN domain-containing protein [Cinnamomum micranthum f. kanehirae]|uniref:DENN domain-containing protein n=1 Tax=Cinnamomum micranthum f. kanehirae TaxID=337451 RepID=A0A3S3NRP4_9MAGN|nr:DENN domain-containing protein [Cinnamomum micranthum f. kanehirae]